jgi:ABC-type antimicrobial peptide transport system permease subunit
MLGIAIGIACITVILSLSLGANKIIDDQISSLDGNIAVIRPGKNVDIAASVLQVQPNQNYAVSSLTESDVELIKKLPNIKSAAPLMILSGTIKADSVAPNYSSIIATTPDLTDTAGLKLFEGQFLDKDMNQNSVIIGTQLSINIFGTESSTGRVLNIRGQQFTVNGVLKRTDSPINYNSVDFDNSAIISLAAGKKLNQNIAQIQQINTKADSTDNLNRVVPTLEKALQTNHSNEKDFFILTGDQVSKPTGQLFQIITGITTAVAAISLIVGGIGIMNIMLVTVAERTREIGIRKALGATNADISWQFLIESLIISLGGWMAGYIVGYLIAFGISTLIEFDPVINWQIAATTLTTSIIVGVVFGLYPAIRAARKDPIASLRQYD